MLVSGLLNRYSLVADCESLITESSNRRSESQVGAVSGSVVRSTRLHARRSEIRSPAQMGWVQNPREARRSASTSPAPAHSLKAPLGISRAFANEPLATDTHLHPRDWAVINSAFVAHRVLRPSRKNDGESCTGPSRLDVQLLQHARRSARQPRENACEFLWPAVRIAHKTMLGWRRNDR
jgi:hypothetical protein